MLPLAVLRPEPGWSATAAAAAALGLKVIGAPLFEIVPVAWLLPEATDAVLLGSANAVRHAGPALKALIDKPAYAVGEATAAAARAAGFTTLVTGSEDLAALTRRIAPSHRRLLRLAGQERTAMPPLSGHEVTERIVYAAVPCALRNLAAPAVIMLHSARAALHFAAECDRLALPRAGLALAALSPQIADAAGGGWSARRSALEPTDAALLALARDMCEIRGEAEEG